MEIKKLSILMFAALLLAACGDNDNVTQEDNNQENEQEEKSESDESNEVEIEEQIVQKYVDSSFDAEVIGVYAKLTNDSDTPATMFDTQVTFYDSNDDILSVEEGDDLIAPPLLDKGDSGYLSLNVDYDGNYEDLDHIEIDYKTQK